MNILWLIHGYPPIHNAGAEWMAHSMNKLFLKKGIKVRVMFRNTNGPTDFQGVELADIGNSNLRQKWVQEADYIFTHLDCQGQAFDIAKERQKQLIVLVHNTYRDELYHPRYRKNWLVINTNWIAEAKKYDDFVYQGSKGTMKTIVCHPPIIKEDYQVVQEDPEYYTLINLNANKGGHLFNQVAKLMPDIKFLGVTGSYASQVVEERDNLVIMPNISDIRMVLEKTKCLMCLSEYESFGMSGMGAMAAGIPVISTRTKGTEEAYGDAALFTDRDPFSIKKAILQMEKEHKKWAKKAEERYAEFDFEKEIEDLLTWMK